jgi:hypothetical protein
MLFRMGPASLPLTGPFTFNSSVERGRRLDPPCLLPTVSTSDWSSPVSLMTATRYMVQLAASAKILVVAALCHPADACIAGSWDGSASASGSPRSAARARSIASQNRASIEIAYRRDQAPTTSSIGSSGNSRSAKRDQLRRGMTDTQSFHEPRIYSEIR